MAKYSVGTETAGTPQSMAATSTYKTLVDITAQTATLRRAWVYDFSFGTNGTPADNAVTFIIDRQTTASTVTTATAMPLDPADAASGMLCKANPTAEPTQTANSNLFSLAMNQRASYRWVAVPGGEIVIPATNAAGIGLRGKSATYASTCTGILHFWE